MNQLIVSGSAVGAIFIHYTVILLWYVKDSNLHVWDDLENLALVRKQFRRPSLTRKHTLTYNMTFALYHIQYCIETYEKPSF